jgi:glutamate synthase (NADPH/NADH) large chain
MGNNMMTPFDNNYDQNSATNPVPGPIGLYDPAEERSSCGVGLVAAMNGEASRDVVLKAIEALKAIWHRGAVDADGKTGDGAGINL